MRQQQLLLLLNIGHPWSKLMSHDMAADTATAVRSVAPMLTGPVVHQYWARVVGLDRVVIALTTLEKVKLSFTSNFLQSLLPVNWIRAVVSYFWFVNYRSVMKHKHSTAEKMRSHHPDARLFKLSDLQSSRCPRDHDHDHGGSLS